MSAQHASPLHPSPEVARAELDRGARRKALILGGPVLSTLIALAVPNLAVILAQAVANFLESYYVGLIGLDALAGAALVFPLVMLMQTMSAGGIGGAMAAAVARAIGAGQREKANALVLHAVVVAVGLGIAFSAALILGGPSLYAAMGGREGGLDAAIVYSNVIFGGAIFLWLMNALASVLRGSGNMMLPAIVLIAGTVLLFLFSPALIFGWHVVPRLGVAGAGLALVIYYALGSAVLLVALIRGSGGLRFSLRHKLRADLFGEILGVGAYGAVNNVMTNGAVVLATGLVGPFGIDTLVGFGLGIRVEYLQIPLVFGIGSGLVPMVGMNMGAGNRARARQVAWTGAMVAVLLTEAVGLGVALFPEAWLRLFTDDGGAVAAGTAYLRRVGPFYGFFGLSLSLYFASQGAGKMLLPTLSSVTRVLIIGVAGVTSVQLGGGFGAVLLVIVAAHVVAAGINALNWVRPMRSSPMPSSPMPARP